MKKRYLFASLLATTLLMTSCSKKEDDKTSSSTSNEQSSESSTSSEVSNNSSTSNSQEVTYANSLELYNASVKKMMGLTYEVYEKGTSITDVSGTGNPLPPMTIYEHLQHKPDELYFEKISNGDPVFGFFGVCFAEKAYIGKDGCRRANASSTPKWAEDENGIHIPEYKNLRDTTKEDIYNAFGKNGDAYQNFIINEKTINDKDLNYETTKEGFTLTFNLIVDKGIDSESIKGYSNQVKTMSGESLKKVNSITLSIYLDKDLRVTSYNSKENYNVEKFNALVVNDLTYNFKYFDNSSDLVITKF